LWCPPPPPPPPNARRRNISDGGSLDGEECNPNHQSIKKKHDPLEHSRHPQPLLLPLDPPPLPPFTPPSLLTLHSRLTRALLHHLSVLPSLLAPKTLRSPAYSKLSSSHFVLFMGLRLCTPRNSAPPQPPRRTSETSAPPATPSSRPPRFSRLCQVCFNTKNDTLVLPCKCIICARCLHTLIRSTSSSALPARCCGVAIPVSIARKVVCGQALERVREAEAISKTPFDRRMYCPSPQCASFINLDTVDLDSFPKSAGKFQCPKCSAKLCAVCRDAWHAPLWNGVLGIVHGALGGLKRPLCPGRGNGEVDLATLARARGWKRCGGCGVHVERAGGCRHMTCRCGFMFCARCGSKYERKGGYTCGSACSSY